MTEIKRTYNIPLRREFQKAPKYRRAKKAMTALKEFVSKHMKSDDIVVMMEVNELLWKNGIKNPPHHIKADLLKTEDGKVYVQISGLEIKVAKEDSKKSPDKKTTEKEKDTKSDKKEEVSKPEEIKEE